MNISKSYLLILALFSVALYSCKKDSNSITNSANISFKVNGELKSTNTISTANSQSPAELQLLATFNTGEVLSFTIANPKTGTFDVSSGAAVITYATDTSAVHTYKGAAGSVTINSLTGSNATGTFQFTGRNVTQASLQITEGTFQTK